MIKEVAKMATKELKPLIQEGINHIKTETNLTLKECQKFWTDVFSESQIDPKDKGHFQPYEERIKHVPKEDSKLGKWEGERGESLFIPTEQTESGKLAIEKLKEHGLEGIHYENAEPDFSKCAESTVTIENMTEERYDKTVEGQTLYGNFAQADEACARVWNSVGKEGRVNWEARDVKNWRQEQNFSWHERSDMKTMDLIPREIHSYFNHSGGVAECKARDSKILGGGFDEN